MSDTLFKYPKEFCGKTGQLPNKELYKTLMQEELWELVTATEKEDILKELTDCLYVLLGYLYASGCSINEDSRKKAVEDPFTQKYTSIIEHMVNVYDFYDVLDEALKRVHENNLGRVVQDDGTVKRREDGKIIKNPNAPKIDLSDLV